MPQLPHASVFEPAKDPGQYWTREKAKLQASDAAANARSYIRSSNVGPLMSAPMRGLLLTKKADNSRPRAMGRRITETGIGALGSTNMRRFASTPVCGQLAPDGPPDSWPSGMNPYWSNRNAMPYGRNLRGLGLVPDTLNYGDTWSGHDPAVRTAAQDDDVAGNGIFDGAGAPPTAHAGTGVFASNFSLPGYVYREQPTEPSEVRDTTTGLPIVFQPGASNWYDDMRETYRPFDLEVPRYYAQKPALPVKSLKGLGADPGIGDQIKAWAPWVAAGVVATFAIKFLIGLAAPKPAFVVGGDWEYGEEF